MYPKNEYLVCDIFEIKHYQNHRGGFVSKVEALRMFRLRRGEKVLGIYLQDPVGVLSFTLLEYANSSHWIQCSIK